MNVIIKNDIKKFAPERSSYGIESYSINGYMNFSKGEKIIVVIINYPGNHHPEKQRNQYSNCDSWVFKSLYFYPAFLADEIDALILTPQERESLADTLFNSAPFEVIVREENVQGTIVRIHSKKLGTINPNER
jgi:hypothetical protein